MTAHGSRTSALDERLDAVIAARRRDGKITSDKAWEAEAGKKEGYIKQQRYRARENPSGLGCVVTAFLLYAYFRRSDFAQHPSPTQAGELIRSLGLVSLAAFLLPFFLLRPRSLR